MENAFVALETCPICNQNTGTILLDRRLRPKFSKQTINPATTCADCKDKYLKEGVLIINPETGSFVVLKEEGFKRRFNIPIPTQRIVFAKEVINSC
jgi:hypothetical protein